MGEQKQCDHVVCGLTQKPENKQIATTGNLYAWLGGYEGFLERGAEGSLLSDLREVPSGEVSELEAEAPREDSEKPGLPPFPPQSGQASQETWFRPSHLAHWDSRPRCIFSGQTVHLSEPLLTSLSQCESQTR